MDFKTFISNIENSNMNSEKYEKTKKDIDVIKKCNQFSQIAYALNNNNPIACYVLGLVKLLYGERNESIALCDKAISIDPEDSYAYFHRGTVYSFLGQFDKAEKDFQTAIFTAKEETIKNSMKNTIAQLKKEKQKYETHVTNITNTKKGRELDI